MRHVTPYEREGGYPTDVLISRSGDEELLAYMGVPPKFVPFIHTVEFPDTVVDWLADLPYIFRPSLDVAKEKPALGGLGLVFTGPSGTRKTTAAAALLLKLVRMKVHNFTPNGHGSRWNGWAMGRFVSWQNASELFREAVTDEAAAEEAKALRHSMKGTGPMLTNGDFLVVDDISRERATEYNLNELHRILRNRHELCRPTILTSNYPRAQWDSVYGEVMATFMARAFGEVQF